MPPNVSELEAQALRLSPEERARLADKLLSSLGADAAVEEAWAAEVDRRIQEWDAGAVQAVPLADSLARARAAIR
ncbi:addiction module protein [Ideonella sp. DXS22W]|uniref:Addiction module protein n=1 Tax=Pseudaquabacterium inlustre TaxID=2984192 RepID=A0ABU9CEW2_9BURK